MKSEAKAIVKKTSPEEEQRLKDEAFLKLKPSERLRIHEQLRRRIWGDIYNKVALTNSRVTKKKIE